jgi:endonuclease/exonuclease/phosphatase family metal-dependent hydrolase
MLTLHLCNDTQLFWSTPDLMLARLVACLLVLHTGTTNAGALHVCPPDTPSTTQKLMFYNILHGGGDRLPRLTAYINTKQVDFLALSELNHWDADRLQQFGNDLSLPFTYFLPTQHGYHLGIASRYSFELLSKHGRLDAHALPSTQQWHHGYIYAYVKHLDLSIFVTHLSPHSSEIRQFETTQILAKWRHQTHPLLVLGDLNTLSPIDIDVAHPQRLVHLFQQDQRLSKKFLNENQQAIDYKPMEMLLSELHDTFNANGKGSRSSVPTGLTNDFMHAAPMRLDYALSSVNATYYSWIDPEPWTVSDHLPLIVQRCDRAGGAGLTGNPEPTEL